MDNKVWSLSDKTALFNMIQNIIYVCNADMFNYIFMLKIKKNIIMEHNCKTFVNVNFFTF